MNLIPNRTRLNLLVLLGLITVCMTGFVSLAATALVGQETARPELNQGLILEPLEPGIRHARTAEEILHKLHRRHYQKQDFDDIMSSRLLDEYLQNLDPNKVYFTQQDLAELEQYRYQLDDGIRRGNLQPSFDIFNHYRETATSTLSAMLENLAERIEQLDYDRDESIALDPDAMAWPANEQERLDRMRKMLKNSVLSLQLSDKEGTDIVETLEKRYRNQLTRLRQLNAEDAFQLYMNSLVSLYDPHSNYMSPRLSENFSINMSLSLEGIGAVLKSEGEYTVVEELVKGGPAELQGQLKNQDRIVGVGQGINGDIEDVIGWRLDEVVQLIRGKKNTVVRLEVLPADSPVSGEHKFIQITRNKVKLEEQAVQKQELDLFYNEELRKIGVIQVPTFYHDYEAQMRGEEDYRSTTRDVERLLRELDQAGVEGVIIDLRGNGGGYLDEARTLTGLFVGKGPVVQIKSANGRIKPQNNYPNPNQYTKPVAVLIDRLSASATEIFAGAMQDYRRGLVIGSQSFGKGTVQNVTELNYGRLKLTEAKYYRVSGESTQHRGIIPDIALPSLYDEDDIGEASLDNALSWDQVESLPHRKYGDYQGLLASLQQRHMERVSDDPDYRYLLDQIELRNQNDAIDALPLQRQARQLLLDEHDAARDKVEKKFRLAKGLPVDEEESKDKPQGGDLDDGTLPEVHTAVDNDDQSPADEDPRSDFLLTETGYILLDAISSDAAPMAQNPARQLAENIDS